MQLMLSRRASNLSHMGHHSNNLCMSDDFIAHFAGPDKRAREAPEVSGAFMGGAFNAPVSPTGLPDISDGRPSAVDPFAAFAAKPGTPAIKRPSMGGASGGWCSGDQRHPCLSNSSRGNSFGSL